MGKNLDQMTPGEQTAFALVHHMVNYNPELVNTLLVQHGEQPSTDPELNMLRIAKLSQERGTFFNTDFSRICEKAGYFGTEDAASLASSTLNGTPDLNQFQNNFRLLGGGGSAGATAAGSTPPKTGFLKGLKDKVGGFLKNVFGKKDQKVDLNTGPDQKLTDLLPKPDDKPPVKKILGMHPAVFYSLIGVVVILVISLIIWLSRAKKPQPAPAVAAA